MRKINLQMAGLLLAVLIAFLPAAHAAGNVQVTSSGRLFEVRFGAEPIYCGGKVSPAHINIVVGGVNFHIGVTPNGFCVGGREFGFDRGKMLKELFSNKASKDLLANSRVAEFFSKLAKNAPKLMTAPIIMIDVGQCNVFPGGCSWKQQTPTKVDPSYCKRNPRMCN